MQNVGTKAITFSLVFHRYRSLLLYSKASAAAATSTIPRERAMVVASVKSLNVSVLGEDNHRKLVEKFKQASENDGFRKQAGIYEEVVKRLHLARRLWLIEEILEDQKKYADVKKEGFCARLISLYGKAGMFKHAVQVFDEMPEMNCRRTVLSLNALLGACVRSKKFNKVDRLFRELPKTLSVKPDAVTYSILIKAYCEMGSLNSAVSMLDEMGKKELKPNLVTFNTLLHGFYRNHHKFMEGERIWDRMGEYEIEPDVWSYNAKFVGLAFEKKLQKAIDLFAEMNKKGLKPDVFTFNSLIKCCCNAGDLKEAGKWYDELRMSKLKPDSFTYSAIIPLACEKGDLDHAFWLCKQLVCDRIVVDTALLQKVVDGLMQSSEFDKAKKLVELGKLNKYCCYQLILSSVK